jgi:hypothetical protein
VTRWKIRKSPIRRPCDESPFDEAPFLSDPYRSRSADRLRLPCPRAKVTGAPFGDAVSGHQQAASTHRHASAKSRTQAPRRHGAPTPLPSTSGTILDHSSDWTTRAIGSLDRSSSEFESECQDSELPTGQSIIESSVGMFAEQAKSVLCSELCEHDDHFK